MIHNSKQTDERREAGSLECWCLHGSVGLAADWRDLSQRLAAHKISTRAVDLWRFLECCPMPIADLLINSASSNKLISFLDGNVGYN